MPSLQRCPIAPAGVISSPKDREEQVVEGGVLAFHCDLRGPLFLSDTPIPQLSRVNQMV